MRRGQKLGTSAHHRRLDARRGPRNDGNLPPHQVYMAFVKLRGMSVMFKHGLDG